MSIEIPDNASEVENRAKTDVKRELPSSNPFLKNSWLSALIVSFANRIYEFYLQLSAAITQSFPDTATGTYLKRWAAIWGKEIQVATTATGNIVATGTAGSTISSGETFTYSSGNYISTSSATVSSQSISVDSIERSGTTATVTTISDHNLANNVAVTISGADQDDYNLSDVDITVTGLDTFEYTVSGSPTTPATGTILADFTSASIPVESEEYGEEANLDSGTELGLQSPLSGIDDTLMVDYGAISGGTDQEDDESLQERLLDRIQNPVAHFNTSDFKDKAKEVAGVTRVFVQEITPEVGQVTIYFMRDDDDDPIPTASAVEDVYNAILEIKPANTDDNDVIVSSPTGVSTDFTFTALSPNTSTMQSAITANLEQFFEESTEVGEDIDEDAYRSAIFNTVDTSTGSTVTSFELSAPSGDISISDGEIATLGNVTFTS